jgi:hypothetical protein
MYKCVVACLCKFSQDTRRLAAVTFSRTPCVRTVHLLPRDVSLDRLLRAARLQQLVSERGEGDVYPSENAGHQQGQQWRRTMFGRGGTRHRGHAGVPDAGEGELP